MSLEVIQPYKPQPINFSSPDEFNIYYNKHADDFNETTYKLNVKYKIPGFKITKIKGELKLIKDYTHMAPSASLQSPLRSTDDPEIKRLITRLTDVETRLASIEHYLQSLNE